MTDAKIYRAIGLMSGTSMDGIDAALIASDGEGHVQRLGFAGLAYDAGFRSRLGAVLGVPGTHGALARELTERHAMAVERLLEKTGCARETVDVIGFHGQTILHRPEVRQTVQIGMPELLARQSGLPVIFGLRLADVAAGGEGAPLVPVYHHAMIRALKGAAGSRVAVLNLGGVGNVTWIDAGAGPDAMLGFDTGPANALLDDFMRARRGLDHDAGGALARTGRVDPGRLAALLDDPFFDRAPPKSLDRDHFARRAAPLLDDLADADGAALLTSFSAAAAVRAEEWFPHPAATWIVCGGGRHNRTLLAELAARLEGRSGMRPGARPGIRVVLAEEFGWNGDAIEAEAFACLAIRSLRGLPITFPGTTGAPRPLTGGTLCSVRPSLSAGPAPPCSARPVHVEGRRSVSGRDLSR